MMTVMQILAVGSVVTTIASMCGKCPLPVPVLLLSIFAGLMVWPK